MSTARKFDTNGWFEVKRNPISKSGVFPYLGRSIPLPGLDPDKFYNVYRPASELAKQETIDSFKLLPWIDGHAMLGPNEDTPAELKGIHGVTGEDVFFEEPILYANLKLFSERLAKKIEDEKPELSLGFNCKWVLEDGVHDGVPYSIVQRNPCGNHLASVTEARCGHEMAVLDQKDEVPSMKEEDGKKEEGGITLTHLKQCIDELPGKIAEALSGHKKEEVKDEDEMAQTEGGTSEYEEKEMPKEEPVEDETEKDGEKKEEKKSDAAMDQAEITKKIVADISRRDALAKKSFPHVGVFDASEMTLAETAKYIVKKLKLSCPPGHENSVLAGYFAAATVSQPVMGNKAAMDSKGVQSPQLRKILYGEE